MDFNYSLTDYDFFHFYGQFIKIANHNKLIKVKTEYEENGLSKKEYVCICWQDESKTTGKCSKCGAKMEEMK